MEGSLKNTQTHAGFHFAGGALFVSRTAIAFIVLLLLPPAVFGAGAPERPLWADSIEEYPVGQTDPFADPIHRLQVLKLYTNEQEVIARDFPGWDSGPTLLIDFFPHCYQSLQLKFDPHDFEEHGLFRFSRDFEPHEVDPDSVLKSNRTYSIHLDRYADPRYEGKYAGAILLIPGTGSYGGNYLKFALSMACLKGYIVYVMDPIYHGRSHGHKEIRKRVGAKGTGVFLSRAISEEGSWQFSAALEPGWEEVDPCTFDLDHFVRNILSVGRRIAHREEGNLAHLNDDVLSLSPELRSEEWYGKPANMLTNVTLIGTSQGGETAFWSADPRATGRGQEAAFGILYPFDSVICHDVYNSAYTAPQKRMRLLRSDLMGGLSAKIMENRTSLWENADWTKYYDGLALFFRAADRWVRWRYDIEAYQKLLRFGEDHRNTLPQMKIPVLVAIGRDDLLYPGDWHARGVVKKLFKELKRDPGVDSLVYLQYQTPSQTNGHQLLVHHTFPFADIVDKWIRYRRAGPGNVLDFDTDLWKRVD